MAARDVDHNCEKTETDWSREVPQQASYRSVIQSEYVMSELSGLCQTVQSDLIVMAEQMVWTVCTI